ncbi:polysialyltransferase family glycosyltransferase [Pseudofulvibacter geojedonensis]|uniref:Polysialyltransferase family glycosyltransferase n=1 Tax=Pseudofulvibacter geojedonensis TaxID=1123758 RepID=A0ABW3HZK4_9FLAO
MNQTFVGCSMYHIYLSMLLAFQYKKSDHKSLLVVIEDRTEGIQDYIEPLKALGAFEDVVAVRSYGVVKNLKKKSGAFNYIFNRANSLKKSFEDENPQLQKYHEFILESEINLYHIVNSRAYFLINYPKNSFRMIEEGTGTYRHKMPFSRKLKRTLMGYPLLMGYDKQVKEVLVQQPTDMQDPFLRAKSVKLDLNYLQSSLTEEEISNISKCFGLTSELTDKNQEKAIILTQPLIEAGFKVTKEEMIAIYQDMINDAKEKGLKVYLKMHPREEIDYNLAFKKEKVIVLPKLLPIELINLDNSIKFQEAYTICSGSIDNLINVKNKNSLGFDYLKK